MKTMSYIASAVLLLAASNAQAADLAKGEAVYKKACAVCHTKGIANSPKLGDKANWAPRIAQGIKVMDEHAIKGFKGKKGVMPAKGGQAALSDADVKDAVAYIVSKSK